MSFRLANLAALLLMPFVLSGVIIRVKALWSGRKGPPILQPLWDVLRLGKKSSVYSTTTTPLFRIAPYVLLGTSLLTALIVPLLGSQPVLSFDYDFLWVIYIWGLGRMALLLAALDTGSAFEGMGAARDSTFATLLEPALFLIVAVLGLLSDTHTLHEALVPRLGSGAEVMVWAAALVTLLIVLQVECARVPVDDPSTHLELTMVHEVMILDHSGPDLAAIQSAVAVRLFVAAAMIATLLNPLAGSSSWWGGFVNLILCLGVGVVVGTIESLIARLRLRAVPQFISAAVVSSLIALLATAWRLGGSP